METQGLVPYALMQTFRTSPNLTKEQLMGCESTTTRYTYFVCTDVSNVLFFDSPTFLETMNRDCTQSTWHDSFQLYSFYIFCAIFGDGNSQPLPTGLDLFLGHTSWPGCPVVVAWLRGYAAMPARHLFCTLKGNYVWRVHEVHTTIAPCLSTALTICLCEVKPSLAVFAGINRVRAGKQTAICQEQIKVAGGSAQRSAERRPVGDFRHPTPDHIYCLPSASCWKTFQQTWLVQAHVSSGGFTLVTMDDKFCFQDVLALECF